MDITEEIYKTIDVIVQRYVDGQKTSPQYSGVVTDSNNGKYTVLVNGSKYLVKDGVGINPKPNTTVWIMVPNNDWNQAYICAGKNNKPEAPVSTVLDVWENGTSVVGSDMIARINCATTAQVQQVQNNLEESVQELQENFQAGVDAVYDAVEAKGATPASHSLSDIVTAIGDIQTGGNYMTKEIREDGVYYASDDGVDAYDVVVVSKDVGQPHTVVFYDADGSTIIKTQANVPYHGSASCTLLDGTILNGQYFKGWNPSPTNIVRDTFCYPIYGDYVITPGEITDDWETICFTKGANYPLGSYKPLVFDVPAWNYGRYDYKVWHGGEWVDDYANLSNPLISVALHMVKVAEGEDGSTSSWISASGVYFSGVMINNGAGNGTSGFGIRSSTHSDWYAVPDWGSSFLRKYLNEHFLSNMPEIIRDTIKEVNKSYFGMTHPVYYDRQTTQSLAEKTSIDKIWIPSRKELQTRCQGLGYNSFCESQGIDYSLIYSHTVNATFTFRTSVPYGENTYYIIQQEGLQTNNVVSGACDRYALFGFCL